MASAERVSPESYGGLCTRRNGACECCWRETALLTVSSNPVQLGQLFLLVPGKKQFPEERGHSGGT